MAIDPQFEDTYDEVDRHEDHRVWTPDGEDPTDEKQGIHGTHVAVDFDLCIADGACLEHCPVDAIDVDPSRAGRI